MGKRYTFTANRWHKANGTRFMWIITDCDAQTGADAAGFYVVLLGDYPDGKPITDALRSIAKLRGFPPGETGEMCSACFGEREGK